MATARLVRVRGQMPSLRTMAALAGTAAFGLLIGGLLAALLATQFFGYKMVTVQSDSMEPALKPGDLIATRPVPIEDVKVGDIVLFDEGRDVHFLAAHRVVGFINLHINIHNSATGEVTTEEARLLRTKGDANTIEDVQPVDASRLRGRLWFTVAGAGLLFERVPIQTVLLGIAGLTAVGWVLFEIGARWPRKKPVG